MKNMASSKKRVSRIQWNDLLTEIVLIFLALLVLYPFINLILSSFKVPAKIFDALSFPHSFYWGNYLEVFKSSNFLLVFGNTLLISTSTIVLIVVLASMAGHVVSRAGKGIFLIVFYMFISGMIIPAQTTMIPIFKLAVASHLIDTRTFMVLLYTASSIPFATLIYSGFVKSIPRELEEAASIDGCGRNKTFWIVIFPLLLPATGTVVVTNIFGVWNDFLGPLLYLYSPSKQTLMTLIFHFKQERTTDWGPTFALTVISTIPLILLFLVVQKQFLKGLTAGAIKG